jgi:hypothetical protein
MVNSHPPLSLFPKDSTMAEQIIKDTEWLRRSFLVDGGNLHPEDYRNRITSSASLKYTDTTPGGNMCINPPPQFTRFADIKATSVFTASKGMGRFYSEAIDDNNQIVHLRFGVESYNSMTTFFSGFYNSSAGQLARTGRSSGAIYLIGKAVGYVVMLASWKLLAVHFLGVAFKLLSDKPTSKFYMSKPAMALYWNRAVTIANHMAVNRGIVPRLLGDDGRKLDPGYDFTADDNKFLSQQVPDIFTPGGGVDLYAIANKAKRLERKRMKQAQAIMDNNANLSTLDLQDAIRKIYGTPITADAPPEFTNNSASKPGYLQRWLTSAMSKVKIGANESATTTETQEKYKEEEPSISTFLESELDDGSQFVSFRVNHTGSVGEGFTNQAGTSDLANKMNGIVSQARSANFSMANGNLIGGAAGSALGWAVDKVRDFTTGVLDSVELSGLATLAGAAFVDIPKAWQTSAAQLPRSTYTINLVSPYGNPISQFLNLDLPLAMLLAGALPKSTGKQSHVGPFMVELYDRGRCQTRLGMIDSIQINRGVGNIAFNQDGKALAIDVTFSVLDMSEVLHAPISENFSLVDGVAQAVGSLAGTPGQAVAAALTGGFDEETVFSDYMAILSGMSLNDQIYPLRKLKLNLTRKMAAFEAWKSPAHIASFIGDTFPARMVGAFYRGTDRR